MRILAIILLPTLLISLKTEEKNCKVSSLLNVAIDGLFTYPLSMLHAPPEKEWKAPLYVCKYESPNGPQHVVHGKFADSKCTNTLQYCPLQDNFVEIALTQDRYGYDFCDLKDALYDEKSNAKPINILIFGGSVTEGQHTEGARCSTELNSNCNTTIDLTETAIGWSSYLTRYFDSEYPTADIRVHHLEHGGTTSGWAAEYLVEFLKVRGVDKLNSRDVVFVDYSVNDQESALSAKMLSFELHDLLHKILHHAESTNSTKGRPRIVMLAQNPKFPPFNHFYYQTYLDTAKMFGASFWSYVDVSYSPYGSAFKTTSEELYRYVRTDGGLNKHFTWFAHLFAADLFASILTFVMSSCDLNPSTVPPDSLGARYTRKPDAPWTLPSQDHPEIGCGRDDNQASHMKLEARAGLELEAPTIVTTIAPEGSWRLYEDRPGKPGWIIETFMNASYGGNLTFPISLKNATESQFVRIEYLRTYEHAGTAEIRLCGQHVATLDALWQNPESYKKSLSYFRTVQLPYDSCWHHPKPFSATLEIISPSFLPPDDPHPHRYLTRTGGEILSTRVRGRRLLRDDVDRGTAKFKLISISMCD